MFLTPQFQKGKTSLQAGGTAQIWIRMMGLQVL
jgi:hypothetical protein